MNNSALNSSVNENGFGGGIFYTCERTLKCIMSVKNNSFKNNRADNSGGAIHWDILEPKEIKMNTYESNFAYLYGNNIGCHA